jgi:hypothetical protein
MTGFHCDIEGSNALRLTAVLANANRLQQKETASVTTKIFNLFRHKKTGPKPCF